MLPKFQYLKRIFTLILTYSFYCNLSNCQSFQVFFFPNGDLFFWFSKTLPLILQVLFAFTVIISMYLWSVAFKLQKKEEKTEDSSSASSEFCKSRKASDGYFFLGSLDRNLEQQRKKKPHKQLLLPTVPISRKRQRSGAGWLCTHPEPARQSSENRKTKLLILRNGTWLFQNYHFSLNYCMEKKKTPTKWAWGVAKTLASVVLVHQFKQTCWDEIPWVKI